MLHNPSKRSRRRAWPIHGYVGANGGGKTAAMVWDVLPTLLAGRQVLSTVRLLDFENPRPCDDPACTHPEHAGVQMPVPGADPIDLDGGLTITRAMPSPAPITHRAAHPLWVPFTDWQQLLEAERCDVLMDEVTGVASSRESHSMPAPVANKLVQLRRADVTVRWSAPSWARADKIIRECSQAVTYARGYLPVQVRDGDRMWRNRRLFRWCTYDAAEFEDFTVGKREQMRPLVQDLHWGPSSPAFLAYDTFDAVLSIGTVSDAGRCLACDGRRTPHDCFCADYVHRKDDAKTAAAEARARAKPEHADPLRAGRVTPVPSPATLSGRRARHVAG